MLPALLFVVGLHPFSIQRPAAPDTVELAVVATTDIHGRVRGWNYVSDEDGPGGLARAAVILETLRARYPDRVVLVDAGDLVQGNPFATYFATEERRTPHPIVDALGALGYDAVTPGNHDFDWGLDLLEQAAGEAPFPYVAANVFRRASDTLVFRPYAVVTRGGVRVGITGFTTPGVMVWDRQQLAGRVTVRPIADVAAAALDRLAAAGVDLTIAISHAGLDGPSSYDTSGVGPENVSAALAMVEPRPDLVVVGHSHRELRDSVINGVHFVQPGPHARSLSVAYVTLEGKRDARGRRTTGYRVVGIRADLIPLAFGAEQPRLVRRVAAAHDRVRVWGTTPLGAAGPAFGGRDGRVEDTPLLDFINEVQRRRTGADLSATTLFDPAAGLPEGEVRLRDLAGVYPYENTLRAVRISGAQLKAFLEHSSRHYHTYEPGRRIVNDSVPGYNFDAVSGADYTIDLSRPVGERVRLAYRRRPVLATDSFTLAVNSYRQEGGGGYAMLQGAPVVYDRQESVRDLLADEVRRAGRLEAAAYYRRNWSLEPPAAREAARIVFAPPPAATGGDSTLLRVLAIADLHGALEPREWEWSRGRPVGGVAALRSWFDSLTRACGCAALRLDAGDQWQGTLVSGRDYGRTTVEALNQLRLDAAAIGNHEFDWTIDTLRARMGDAGYPFVSANIFDSTGTARPGWIVPWTVIERGGVRASVIGVTTRGTVTSTSPRVVRGLAFGDGAAAVRGVLPPARAAADFVIVLAHAGALCDSAGCTGEVIDLARGLDSAAVDLIVAGHTHRGVNTVVNGIPIIEPWSSGSAIAVVDLVRAGARRTARARLETLYADAVAPHQAIAGLVDRAVRAADSVASQLVARLRYPLPRDGDEYALGRLIADAQRLAARADVAIMNSSGIRTGLPGGPVTYGDLYQVQPFQNRLVRLRVRGDVLLRALEHGVSRDRGAAHVSGVELWYDPRRPAGRRITRARLDGGGGIERDRTYALVVNDFIAAGGSGYAMLASERAEDLGLLDLDALIRYLRTLRQPVDGPAGARIHRAGGE